MAKKRAVKKKGGKRRYGLLKILCGLTIVVACLVLFVGGIQAGTRTVKILYRCLVATAVIGTTFGIVIKTVSSYEEINGG
jgi:hypothetical protein